MVSGSTTVAAGANPITLGNAGNDFASIGVTRRRGDDQPTATRSRSTRSTRPR